MSIDAFIVVGFLILTLAVGLSHSKKIKTIKDYALGGRNFSTGALVSTLVATWVSGSGFFTTLSMTYTDGLYYVITAFGMSLGLLLTAFFLIPRMGEFLGDSSVAESMGNLYGKNVRIITAIAGIMASIGFVGVQFKVFGGLCSYFLGFSNIQSVIIAATIVTIYSAFGGIKAVTFTDVIQILTFSVAIPIVGIMIWNKFYYSGLSFSNSLSDTRFNFHELFNLNNPKFLETIPLLLYFSIPSLQPAVYQRILIGNNLQQIKKAFILTALSVITIELLMSWIPFLIFNIDSNISSNQLLGYIVDNYTYVGLKGLLVAGIVAMAMSTADSYINSSSVLFSHDICIPLNIGKNKELLLSKIFALFVGIIGAILALSAGDLLSVILTANSFYMPIVVVPLILSILGFRSSTKSVLISMCAGFITVIIWKLLRIKADCIVFAMFINLLFLVGSHYILKQKGGWIGIKDQDTFDKFKQLALEQKRKHRNKLRKFSILNYCKKHSPNNELSYVGLGVYLIIYSIATMYSTQEVLLEKNTNMILAFYQIMLVTGTLLFTYPIWPKSINRYNKKVLAQVLWPIIIFYTLIFFNAFFLMVGNFGHIQVSMFTMNLLIASILLGWQIFGIFIIFGLFAALKLHLFYNPDYIFDIQLGSPAFIAIYIFLLIGASVVLFIKPKQEEEKEKDTKIKYLEKEVDYTQRELDNISQGMDFLEKQFKQKEGTLQKKEVYLRDQVKLRNSEILKLTNTKDEFLRNITHESNTPMTGILSMCDVLYSCYDQLDSDHIKRTIKDIVNSGDRLKTYVNSIVDLSKLSSNNYKLTKEDINLGELAKERTILYKKIFSDEAEKQEFIFDIKDDFIVNCDRYYITQAIDNLISNSVTYGKNKTITISIKRTDDNSTSFSISDQGIGIAKTELLSIFEKFAVSSKTKTLAGGRGVGLALCKSVIEAHDGSITATSKGKGATFTFTLPK